MFFLLMATGAISATAQTTDSTRRPMMRNYTPDRDLSRWVIDVNFLGGVLTQDLTRAATAGNYLNGVNVNEGTLKFNNGTSFGGDAQLGYFFGHGCHWGIGTGIMYLSQSGNATLDNFHAEYQATDPAGNIYRQIVSPNQQIKEDITISNVNIPLVLKYKARFSKHWGFTGDAGLLFNMQMKNAYKTNASFDYEAAYLYSGANKGYPTSYDNSPVPNGNDFLITKAHYIAEHPNGDVNAYFAQQKEAGFNVGLGVKPNTTSGSVSYTTGNVGFLFQPSLNYYLSDNFALNGGVYYLYQGLTNTAQSGYQTTSKMGDYSSPLNSVTKTVNQSYGVNLGIRILFGKQPPVPVITSEDAIDPTKCGLTDGAVVLHGIKPGSPVTVTYKLDGKPQPDYYGVAQGNGTVMLTNLAAGTYTDIVATLGRHKATGTPISLVNPQPVISSESSGNPTSNGACDGTITLKGLRPDEYVTVNCYLNGAPAAPLYGKVSLDNTLVLRGLCAGTYTHIVASVGKCTANGTDITLSAPPPPPPPPVMVKNEPTVTGPIYFDVNRNAVHTSSLPILESAAKELGEEKDLFIIVDGHADKTGSASKNQVLSLKRANAVKKYLVEMGVNPSRIKVVGHGSAMPAASNDSPEGRALNRRATMQIGKGGNEMKVDMKKR